MLSHEYMGKLNPDMAKLPPNMTDVTVYMDKELKLQFKLACTAQERSMSEVVVELVESWLEENGLTLGNKDNSVKAKGAIEPNV